MRLSKEGLELIKRSEGFRAQVYRDVAGFPTVGYGHLIQHTESFPVAITEPQAAALLTKDVQAAELSVSRLVKVELTQGQFDALVDFCFNLGAGRLAASTLLRELNAGRHDAAAEQLLSWITPAAPSLPASKRAAKPSSSSGWVQPVRRRTKRRNSERAAPSPVSEFWLWISRVGGCFSDWLKGGRNVQIAEARA